MILNYWNHLNDRERLLSILGGLFVLLYLFYILLFSPLTHSVLEKKKQLQEKQETLTWMEQVRHIPKTQKTKQVISNHKLLAVMGTEMTLAFKPFPYQLQQTGMGDIQVSFEAVPYTLFINWLWQLSNTYALSIKQFNIERSARPGVVKLHLVLTAV